MTAGGVQVGGQAGYNYVAPEGENLPVKCGVVPIEQLCPGEDLVWPRLGQTGDCRQVGAELQQKLEK